MDGNYDDWEWEPPSETEMKLIEARRERSDKISKLMGDYLLKGYKMLGVTCPACDTILLQTKQGTNYCIACSELDSDADKDDPVTNQTAAMALAREREITSPPSRPVTSQPSGPPSTAQNRSQSEGRPRDHVEVSSANTAPQNQCLAWPRAPNTSTDGASIFPQTSSGGGSTIGGKQSELGGGDGCKRVGVLLDKMDWAVAELRGAHSVEYSIQLCQLVKACAEAVSSVRTALES